MELHKTLGNDRSAYLVMHPGLIFFLLLGWPITILRGQTDEGLALNNMGEIVDSIENSYN